MLRVQLLTLVIVLAPLSTWAAEQKKVEKVDPEPAGRGHRELTKGTWELTQVLRNGQPSPLFAQIGTLTMTFEKNRVKSSVGGRINNSGTWKIDRKKKPMTIDMTTKGMTTLGIFKIDKGQLTIAFAGPGGVRPKGFDKTADYTYVFKKQKAK